MVKPVKEGLESNTFRNNMMLDYIEDWINAVSELPELEDAELTSAIKKVYDACSYLEDAYSKLSNK